MVHWLICSTGDLQGPGDRVNHEAGGGGDCKWQSRGTGRSSQIHVSILNTIYSASFNVGFLSYAFKLFRQSAYNMIVLATMYATLSLDVLFDQLCICQIMGHWDLE